MTSKMGIRLNPETSTKKIYFTAGPATIPAEVMKQVHEELLDYNGLNISVLEMSHRSNHFKKIITEAEMNLRKLMEIPDNYAVLFMHGGAKTQFDSVPMNLCPELEKFTADYIVSGTWSKMAANDAQKYIKVVSQNPCQGKFTRAPASSELQVVSNTSYRYYCDNETIQGVEFNYVPESAGVPLVTDMTSNFLSRPVDVKKFGVIFAGAQKNCGISGLTIVVVRKDLIGHEMKITPTIQNYKVMLENNSLYNTPLTFAIYVANLCFKWMLERGGLTEMDKRCSEKSQILYDLIDNSDNFYYCPVEKDSRSRMNVTFLLNDKDHETKFLEEAEAANMFELKGHRSVGGFRASLYHGVTLEDTKRLAEFMLKFKDACLKRN